MRIYVADLAEYNDGNLIGLWIDALDDNIQEQVDSMLAEREHEEWAIHDYEGFFNPLVIKKFAQYMHIHRKMSNGSYRDSDNWQNGFGDYEEHEKTMC